MFRKCRHILCKYKWYISYSFFCTTQFFLYFIIFSNKKVFEIADLNDCYMSIIFLEKLMLVPFSKLKWVYLCGWAWFNLSVNFLNLVYIDKKLIFWRLILISFYKCNKSVKISVKTIFPCILILIHKLHTTFTVYIKRIPFG